MNEYPIANARGLASRVWRASVLAGRYGVRRFIAAFAAAVRDRGMRIKAEGLTHTSVGQRPTLGAQQGPSPVRAASAFDFAFSGQGQAIRKAFSLEILLAPLRRALPYAIMRKAFSLWVLRGKKADRGTLAAQLARRPDDQTTRQSDLTTKRPNDKTGHPKKLCVPHLSHVAPAGSPASAPLRENKRPCKNKRWNFRTLELQNFRTSELQNFRTLELQNFRTLELQNFRTLELQNFRTLELQNFRTSELQNFRTLELQNFRTSELQNFRTSELQNFRTLELQNFRTSPRASARGFTLVETALALLAIGIGLIGLFGLGRLAKESARETENDRRCAVMADAVFETLRAVNHIYIDEVRTNMLYYHPDLQGADVESGYWRAKETWIQLWAQSLQLPQPPPSALWGSDGRLLFPPVAGMCTNNIPLFYNQNLNGDTLDTWPAYDPTAISLANWNPRYHLSITSDLYTSSPVANSPETMTDALLVTLLIYPDGETAASDPRVFTTTLSNTGGMQ